MVIAESQRRIKCSAYWIPVFSGLNPRFHACDHDKQTLCCENERYQVSIASERSSGGSLNAFNSTDTINNAQL